MAPRIRLVSTVVVVFALGVAGQGLGRATTHVPTAYDDRYEVERSPALVRVAAPGVLRNDVGAGSATSVTFSSPSAGTLTPGPNDGSFEYQIPSSPENLLVTFTYSFRAGGATSNVATVQIKVGNRTPQANDRSFELDPGIRSSVTAANGLLVGASDPDEDPLRAGGTDSNPAQPGVQVRTRCGGVATVAPDGSFTFDPGPTPPENDPLFGCKTADEFDFDVSDGYSTGGGNTGQTGRVTKKASITFRVIANRAPVANDDEYRVQMNTRLRAIDPVGDVPAPDGVLVNDSDPDRDKLGTDAQTVITGQGGRAAMKADGTFDYDPPTGFSGVDRFTYVARETETAPPRLTDSAEVRLFVGLQARPDRYTTPRSTALTTTKANGLLSNDEANPDPSRASNPLEVTGWRWSANPGTGHSLTVERDGSFTYSPPANFTGDVQLAYDVADASGARSTAPATITVAATPTTTTTTAATASTTTTTTSPPTANRRPVARDHAFERIAPGTFAAASPGLLAGASDPDGDRVTVSTTGSRATAAGGVVAMKADGSFTYTAPSSDFVGQDSFTYRVTDGRGGTDDGRARVEVRRARTIHDACPPDRVPSAGYRDVPPSSAHALAINCVAWWNVARGSSTGPAPAFRPHDPVTRAQMATFIANVIDQTRPGLLPSSPRDHFDDDRDNVHERNINRLAEAGVVRGVGGRAFGPDRPVTRGQMATFLVNAIGGSLNERFDYFDDDASNVHEVNINKVAGIGLAAGTGSRLFSPGADTRRDQMASFVARALDWSVEAGRVATPR